MSGGQQSAIVLPINCWYHRSDNLISEFKFNFVPLSQNDESDALYLNELAMDISKDRVSRSY